MFFYIWLVVLVVAIWMYVKKMHRRFSSYGVKSLMPSMASGDTLRIMLRKEHIVEQVHRAYNAFSGEKFIGRYEFMNPMILVKDIELIKKVTVKDFEYFVDHRSLVTEKSDSLFGRTLITLKGQEWKDMRSTLSPAFTSSKIRLMLPFMVDVGIQMIESLKKQIQESNNKYIDIDAKDLTSRYANDVIATCAFGLNVDSHTDKNNRFYEMGKRSVNFSGIGTFFKLFFFIAMPKLMEKFSISLFSREMKDFFRHMVTDAMKDREARKIIRPDMIHLLMEAKKGKLVQEDKTNDADAGFATVRESSIGKKNINRDWSDDHLTAQAILFFIAGFDTVSSAMSFALYELAVNPDVQEKLVQEIRETDAKNGGKFDYTTIQKMEYMDMVVSEVLRLWPPGAFLDRVCVKDYNMGKASDNPDAKDYYIRAGESMSISVYSIHRDPAYFPNPLKFDPERFSDKNKHNIDPFIYMPFGAGPRNCIGSRFALCEVKVMLYQLLLHMELAPCEKTCIPAQLDPKSFNFVLLGGHWLRIKKRT